MLKSRGVSVWKGAVALIVLLAVATLGILLTMTSAPARISAHDPSNQVFWLECAQTEEPEGSIHPYVVLKAPTAYWSHFYAYWYTGEWEADENDYVPRNGDEIHSTNQEADRNEYWVWYENKHDNVLEGPERYWAYYEPTGMTDMSHWQHDNKCPMTIVDADWRFTGVEVISEPDGDTYYLGDVIEIAANLAIGVDEVENDPTMRIWLDNARLDVVYDRLEGGWRDRAGWIQDQQLVFSYVVQEGDIDANGIEISGGLKTDFTEDFIPAWPQGDIKYTELSDHKVDGTQVNPRAHDPPDVSITSSPARNETYDKGESIEFALTFPTAIDVRGYPALAIEVGDKNDGGYRTAVYKSGSGTNTIVFTYTVQVGDRDDDGVTVLGTYFQDEFDRGVLLGSATLTVSGTDVSITPEFEALKHQSGHKVNAPGGL